MTMFVETPTGTLAERLRKARLLADLDQNELAAQLGIARNSISNYETGRSEPSASTFVRWAQITGVTLEWLAEGVNAKTAPVETGAVRSVRPEGLEPPTF
ncbi:helix-turn-helix transcriptional regulator [Agromyces sp. G08B096]|uniref:Helix-turn-helix transcriptional regulator n=1 Tax=Agromyces sp. G08B096 TaxID=3156399 RepID=A0AAU7W6B8_9MICO